VIKYLVIILLLSSFNLNASEGIEHVPISHPVYDFLLHAENKGYLSNESLAMLPLQRKQIINLLSKMLNDSTNLTENEKSTLELFCIEFRVLEQSRAVVFFSESDSTQIIFNELFSDKEKFIYYSENLDKSHNVSLVPLFSTDLNIAKRNENNLKAITSQFGFRIFGTLSGSFGYYMQATNGSILGGNRDYALEDEKLAQNVKFNLLNSDIDFTESHIRYDNDWFYASIGRETRLMGAGLNQRLFIASTSPAIDALTLGARFKGFEYRYIHGSLLSEVESGNSTGFMIYLPPKYMAIHRISVKPRWGEISFWESVIYSNRSYDLAYLNPFSFLKSLEHALHDRDNSMMGFDFTIRPFDKIQVKGSFLLDDIIFKEIGKGYWSNKWAYNLSVMGNLFDNISAAIEYAKVEPYTFSHFNPLNAMTNDGRLFGSILLPNSQAIFSQIQYWYGGRYPIKLDIGYTIHGENIYENDSLIYNAGGDFKQTNRNWADKYYLDFLEGNLKETIYFGISGGFEIVRGFNTQITLFNRKVNSENTSGFRILFRYEDF